MGEKKIGRGYNKKLKSDLILLESSRNLVDKEALLFYLSANHHLLLKEYSQAYENYLKALNLGGRKWDHYLIATIKQIVCLDQMGKYKEIVFQVDSLLEDCWGNPDLLYLAGKAYYKTGNYLKVLGKLRECLKLGEEGHQHCYLEGCTSYKTYYLLGKTYEKIEDYPAALDCYEKALLTHPLPNKPALRITRLLLKIYDKDQVVEELESYFNLDTPESLTILAYIFYENKCYDLALVYSERAIKVSGRLDYLVYLQGCSLFFLNHFTLSKALFRKIPSQSDYYYAAQDFLCWCYWEEGNYSQVEQQVSEMKKDPSYQQICEVYSRLNLILSGERNIPSLPILDKENSQDWTKHILWILERQLALGKQSCFEVSLLLLDLIPNHNLWVDLSKLCYYYSLEEKAREYLLYHLKNKNYEESSYEILRQVFRKETTDQITSFDSSSLEVAPYLSYYSLAEMYYQAEEYEEALIHYKHSLTLNPNFLQPLYKMVSILLTSKEELQAQNYLEGYFNLNNPNSLFLLAHLFYQEKRYQIALEYLKEVKGSPAENQQAAYYSAKCLYKMNKYEESLKNLELVKKESKHYFSSLDCACYCLWAQGDFKKVEEILKILAQNSENILQVEIYKSFNNYLLGKNFNRVIENKKFLEEKEKWIYRLIEKVLELRALNDEIIWNWLEKRGETLSSMKLAKIYYKINNYQRSWQYLIKGLEEGVYSEEVINLSKKLFVLNFNNST